MTLAEFEKYLRANVIYETIYDDTEGRRIVVIRMLELYALLAEVEAKLKEKNT